MADVKAMRHLLLAAATFSAVATAAASPVSAAALVEETGLSEYVRGRHAASAGDLDRAAIFFERALGTAPQDAHLLKSTFESAVLAGQEDLAVGTARRLADSDAYDSAVGTVLFVDAMKRRRWDQADEQLGHLRESGFGSFVAPVMEAWTLAARGKEEEARALLSADTDALSESYAREHRGHLAMIEGRPAEAAEAYSGLIGEDEEGRNWRARLLLADAYQQAGRADYAQEVLEPAPETPDVLRARARLTAGEDVAEAPADERAAVGQLLIRLAADLSRSRSVPLALAFARSASWIDPNNSRAWLLSSQLLAEAEQHEEALQAAEQIREDETYDSLSRAQTAAMLTALERGDEALLMLEDAAAAADADARSFVLLGEAYQQAERYDEAIAAFEEARSRGIDSEQLSWQVLFMIGAAEEQRGDWAAAEHWLREAMVAAPEQATVLNYLGYMMLDRGENVDEAIDLIERAHRLEPNNGHITDSLGWAQYRRGNYAEAVRTLEQAVASVPGDPTINEHLGDAYWRVGRLIEARFRWRAALDADPAEDQRAGLEAKLSYGLSRALAENRTTSRRD